jgi:K+-dependent Na+/Ca+ exchanger related-protein
MIDILILILGLALILVGANYLVDGSSAIAKRAGLSDFIIGMTIVGFGTSAPEMVVSVLSAAQGNADIAVGNVVGSNIFNVLVILGLTSVFYPIPLTSNNIKKDIPFGLLAAFVLCVIGCGTYLSNIEVNVITRVSGILLLCFFGVFMAYTIYSSQKNSISTEIDKTNVEELSVKKIPMWLSIIMVVGGLGGLIWGGNLFVESASSIASKLGVSDAVIAITIMAGGTSLPELASCVVAAYKKKTDLALGNVIGSNVFNIFLILGVSASINPLNMSNITNLDLVALLLSSLLLFIFAFTFKKKMIDRIEGVLLLLLYILFIYFTINGI